MGFLARSRVELKLDFMGFKPYIAGLEQKVKIFGIFSTLSKFNLVQLANGLLSIGPSLIMLA